MVVCYTNHALDQFLEDLLKIGIPSHNIARLGGRANSVTEELNVYNQARRARTLTPSDWSDINIAQFTAEDLRNSISAEFRGDTYEKSSPSDNALLDFLEFEDREYYEAFRVPSSIDGMQIVSRGKAIKPDYLLKQWKAGHDAGVLESHPNISIHRRVWSLPAPRRQEILRSWLDSLLQEEVQRLSQKIVQHNRTMDEKDAVFSRGNALVMSQKRIIAATTTGAAKYRDDIKVSAPGVLLVEEAGEILESHIISAIGTSIHHTILIGDHQQLRDRRSSAIKAQGE